MKDCSLQKFDFEIRSEGLAELFYSNSSAEERCIGHLRADFGDGTEFYTSWWPHAAEDHNTPDFQATFQKLITTLRRDILKDRRNMLRYIEKYPGVLLEDHPQTSGYHILTAQYEYYLRCTPEGGCYNVYLYCYLRDGIDRPLKAS